MTRRITALALVAGLFAAACSGGDEPAKKAIPAPRASKTVQGVQPASTPIEPASGWLESGCELDFEQLKRVRNGLDIKRSPEVIFVPREPNFFGGFTSTTHSGPWDYVQRVPLVFYGPGYIKPQGEIALDREPTITDIAPTLAELLGTPFPKKRPGKVITEALVPRSERRKPPRAVVTVVWDGGGWNVLDTWPEAWPFLQSLMDEGTSVADAVVGSSPSVTPAIHANLGTGSFPRRHGIVDIPMRDGDRMTGAYRGRSPHNLRLATLADLYDAATNNRAKIGMFAYKSWHLGMIGHGSFRSGGDKDVAIIAEKTAGHLVTNPDFYSLPEYLQNVKGFNADKRRVDREDGKVDGLWMEHDVLNDGSKLRHTPVWALYQTRLIKTLMRREGYGADRVSDLLFVNYKQVDDVGHDWNMLNPEMESVLRYSDETLQDLHRFLNDTVGHKRWVMVVTADHGQGPDPQVAGAWPIRIQPLGQDVADNFGVDKDALFDDERPVGFWVNAATMAAADISAEDISDFLLDYRLEDNSPEGEEIPDQYQSRLDEPLFAAAFPRDRIDEVWDCAKARR